MARIYIALDLEPTGLNPKKDSITEAVADAPRFAEGATLLVFAGLLLPNFAEKTTSNGTK